MALFQPSVLNKYLQLQDPDKLTSAYKKFCRYFHNKEIQQNIRESKEEQFQEGFLRELFVSIFNYTLNPKPKYNLTTEFKNEKGSKKADGAILVKDKALAVIELKGTKTKDLESIRQQAFDYKANQSECVYVITSNFEKLRFYINNAVDYEEFNLFTLTEEEFALLYLCLHKDNILSNLPLKIKNESIVEEEKITKKFYKDYSLFKRELYRDLVKENMKNQVFRNELENGDSDKATKNIKLTLFKKSQKLIDRFLFIFFAEDRGLLPPNSVIEILKQWEKLIDLDEEVPLYNRYKKYFHYLDTGRKGTNKKAEIFAYNGGLFQEDKILDSLIIDNALLYKHTKALSTYDFESQVDVNILGHIFENSLNEIESVNAEIEGGEFDKQKTKRKKDGVFYTPKYITKYIVDNTVGKLCIEKKEELGINKIDFEKNYILKTARTFEIEVEVETGKGIEIVLEKRKTNISQEGSKQLEKLDLYREFLLGLSILDPACGSGAFLNQAIDFLIKEHKYIDEMQANIQQKPMAMQDIENMILEKNIYGVDINEESVEIAKLSLWLRTAQPRRKLTSLNNNIKCGNSLIDSKSVAGNKAFKWEEEFPEIFAKGGFDVVIGNPPYVHLEAIRSDSEKLSKLGYVTFDKRGDLYGLFVEKGFKLAKANGMISYIMPNKWLQAGYGKSLREFFLEKRLIQLIDFGDFQIFEGATTYPCIFIAQKTEKNKTFNVSVLKNQRKNDFFSNVVSFNEIFQTSEFSGDTWVISSKQEKRLLSKISNNFKSLKETIKDEIYYGIKTGLSDAFLINEEVKIKLDDGNANTSKLIHPFLQGRNAQPFASPNAHNYLLMFKKGFTKTNIGECEEDEAWEWLKGKYPSVCDWLLPFKKRGQKRTDKGDYWWEVRACDYYDAFLQPKIIYQTFQVKPCFAFDESGLFCNNSMWIIPTDKKELVGLLNSKMGWWLITKFCTQIQNGYQLIWKYFGQIPIPELSNPKLLEHTELRIELSKKEQELSSKFLKYFQSQFNFESLSKKLQNWHSLEFGDFIKELNKAIKKAAGKKLSKLEEMEWMEVFEAKKAEAVQLHEQIKQTDKEIDQMVYELYGLSEEEIRIVEES